MVGTLTIRGFASLWILMVFLAVEAQAESFTEQNRKVIYLRESGSGPEQKHAAMKLDNVASLAAGCFEDILILDISSETGKKTYRELQGLLDSKAVLKTISFSKDEEGDCRLESYQK